MEYVDFNAKGTQTNGSGEIIQCKTSTIKCCECGILIQPNARNMCVTCLREHIDIAEGICKQVELQYCNGCERFLQPPGEWVHAEWESRELLGLCLKKLKGLKNLELIDASFIWTERHSKRIKLKLVVEENTDEFSSMRQGIIIDYIIRNQMCDECHRVEAKDFWRCVVQVRQHAENKKTYLYLEQVILKHKAHENTLGIKPNNGGLDFFYASVNHARKMVNFLESMVPVKVTPSKRLISYDQSSNVHHYKYTWSVEIAPLSKDCLVCLPQKIRHQLGNLPPLCLVYKVTHGMHLIDPMTTQMSELSSLNYFRSPFFAICNPKQLIEFVVMDVELLKEKKIVSVDADQSQNPCHYQLCDIWLVRASQLGTNSNTIHTRSHLGHILSVGDSVMGYSMKETNINDTEFDKLKSDQIPDIILVRKCYDRTVRNKRSWQLKHLTYGPVDEHFVRDKIDFIEDLEEDADIRKNIDIYRDHKAAAEISETNSVNEMANGITPINFTEILDEVHIKLKNYSLKKKSSKK